MKKIWLIIGLLTAANCFSEEITDSVDGDYWKVIYGRGVLMTATQMVPTAGSSYFGFSITPGTGATPGNRAAAKDFGVTLQSGYTYTITGDFNVEGNGTPFIGDAFSTAASEQVAFGFFVTNGINMDVDWNSERAKVRDAINDILESSETSVIWVSRTIPDGSGTWQTWSYTFSISKDSAYAGKQVWFGIYGGHVSEENQTEKTMAFDNLKITVTPPSIKLVVLSSR